MFTVVSSIAGTSLEVGYFYLLGLEAGRRYEYIFWDGICCNRNVLSTVFRCEIPDLDAAEHSSVFRVQLDFDIPEPFTVRDTIACREIAVHLKVVV